MNITNQNKLIIAGFTVLKRVTTYPLSGGKPKYFIKTRTGEFSWSIVGGAWSVKTERDREMEKYLRDPKIVEVKS